MHESNDVMWRAPGETKPSAPAGSSPDSAALAMAFSNSVSQGDLEGTAVFVRLRWFELLRDHGDLVRESLLRLSTAQLRAYPLLSMLLGLCLVAVPHRRVRGLRYFVLAARSARARRSGLKPVDRALILVSQSAAYRLIGQLSFGVPPARAAMRALDSLSVAEREEMGDISRVYAQVGVSLYYGAQVDDALDAFSAGFGEAPTDRPSGGFGNISMIAGILAERGDLTESHVYLEMARGEPWTSEQRSMYTGTFYRIAEALHALERFDHVTAQEQLDAMVHDRRTIEHWMAIARTEAMVALVAGRPGVGLSNLDAFAAMRGTEGRNVNARAGLASTRALLQLALGSADAASAILRRDAPESPQSHVDRARVELVWGRTGGALSELRSIAGAAQSTRTLAQAAALEAAALLRFSTSRRAGAVLEHLGSLLMQSGQMLAVALMPAEDFERTRTALIDAGFAKLFDQDDVRSVLPGTQGGPQLSKRELAVLTVLMHTGSTSQIAQELVVSVNTIKTQLRSLYRKLGVSSRDEAIAVALDQHLLVRDD